MMWFAVDASVINEEVGGEVLFGELEDTAGNSVFCGSSTKPARASPLSIIVIYIKDTTKAGKFRFYQIK